MPIPDFQSIMLPMLEVASDGELRKSSEYRAVLADYFQLTDEELNELLPSGTQPVFTNRVAWAMIYLQRARLLDRPRRGHYKISDRGREVLAEKPDEINIKFLQRYPEFNEFQNKTSKKEAEDDGLEDATPEETLEAAYHQLRSELALDILEHVKAAPPVFFERLVVELLVSMGYGGSMRDAGMAIGKAGDEGIDGIIKEDRLGLDVIYLQAKRWEGTVGRREIQQFVGALQGKRARKGVFLTTGAFTDTAREYAASIDTKVILIDGKLLSTYMIDYGIGVTTKATYQVKRIDSDYFNEE